MGTGKTIGAAMLLLLASCGTQARTYDEAVNAYSQNRVPEAEAALRKIAAEPGTAAADRARAYRELARISLVIDGNAVAALAHLSKAEATGQDGCENARMRARILNESGRAAELLSEVDGLAGLCAEAAHASRIRLRAAESALDLTRQNGGKDELLSRAQTLIDGLTEDARGSLPGSAIALRLALLRGNAAAAVQAWKDYFWLAEGDLPQGLRAGLYPAATPIFAAGLDPAAPPEARLRLVDLLIRAGFAEPAEQFAALSGLAGRAGTHPLWRKATAYFEARAALEQVILASNRRVARGGKATDLAAAFDRAKATLIAGAGLRGDAEPALRQAYGLAWTVGDTDGYASVHLGHAVQDERRTIEQYGHRADVAFLALDNMIANGFNSWLWDGSAAAGGWTAPGPVIVQVRPEYTSGPLGAWSLFSGGAERGRLIARQRERAAADATALGGRKVAYLPGLADRLRMQVADQIGMSVKAKAAGGADLKRAFLDEYWRGTFQSSILSHEGRHALDRKLVRGLARLNDSNLEYRAKLSELALSDYPRLSLLNINDSTIGSGNAHGKANERVLGECVAWMVANKPLVAGFEAGVPAMMQIDRLTDDQIRRIARSLDPIAK